MASPEIETRLFIDGKFVPSIDGAKFDVINPYSGDVVAQVYEGRANDVDRAVNSAKKAFPSWSEVDGSERRRLMLRLADLMDEHAEEFARLEAMCMGKPVSTYMDQVLGAATLRYYAGKALDVHGVTSLTSKDHLNLSIRQPYGVTGAIIPWNVPMIMICFKVGPALIAGNTLVLKSSEKAPLTSILFAKLAHEAGFPPGVLNILSGFGLPCGDAIARHMDIRKITFTGSTRTGKLIQKAAVDSNLKSCTLELGGKSPLLVFEDADLGKAAKAAAFSIVSNSGQVCMASSRVYVQESIVTEFTELYVQAIRQLSVQAGNPLEKETRFGPQADAQQFNSVSEYLQKAQDDRLKKISIGAAPEKGNNFVAPVVFQNVPEGHVLMKDEIFGTVSCLNTFTSEDEVIRAANDSEYGLYASVFTRDISRAIRVAKSFEAGSVGVNTTSPYYCQDLPLGGYKGSGTGRELGEEGLLAWTEVKSVYISLKRPTKTTTLVRRESARQAFHDLGVQTVLGTLADKDVLAAQTAASDIVIHTATADDLPSVEAVLAGIRQRSQAGHKTIYIHTSGASLIGDNAEGSYKTDFIYDDNEPASIDILPDSAAHRAIDLAIVHAGKTAELSRNSKLAIMIPPVIVGVGSRD
ncbi:hypothetical protein AtubIFM54640_011260 [Aspergillus tubingensis]|nr:hypothetical protein AtubIFM54640_011260 [Aspergillus tubingensis]